MTDLARRLRLSLALGVLSDARLNRREREALAVLREAVEALLSEASDRTDTSVRIAQECTV